MKTVKIISLLATGLVMLFACQTAPLEKAAVESTFTPSATAPTVSLDLETYVINNVEGYAVVSLTVSGITEGMDSLEVGFLAGTDSTMLKTTFFPIENPADGTYTDTVKVVAGKINYVQACAAVLGAASLSEVLALNVPDIEWYKKLPKQYYAKVASYTKAAEVDEYDSVIAVSFDATTGVVYFAAFDPYFAEYGYTQPYTYGLADLEDLDHPTVNFTIDEKGYFPLASTNGIIEYYECFAQPLTDDLKAATSYKITFNKAMDEMTVQAWALIDESDDPLWDLYPTVTYKEKTN